MMRQRYSIETERRQSLMLQLAEALASERDVVFAYVFGSFLEAASFHDIDLGVYLDAIGPEGSMRRMVTMAARLSACAQLPVDVRILNQAPASFLYHVFKGQLIMSRDNERLVSLIEETMCRYLDASPLLRQATKDAYAA
ncbi:MAG: nucleotidyltransferase domain-containing protein [Nitrospira defluvii]|nr:nucleotidyltransferase domain-containing protein [Nitrospira defluvii]